MQIALFFRRVEVPNHVVWQAVNPIPGDFCHLCESFSLDLVIHWFDGEVDA